MSQRHNHLNLAKCIKNIKSEQERNTWFIDTFYTSLTLTRKGRRLLRKWNKLYTKEWDNDS